MNIKVMYKYNCKPVCVTQGTLSIRKHAMHNRKIILKATTSSQRERELVNHTITLPNFHVYLSTVLESFTQCRATTELQAQDIGTDIWR